MKNYEELKAKMKERIANTNPEDLALEMAGLGMEFENPPKKVAILTAFMKARDLISDPQRWTQKAAVRNQYGKEVELNDFDAVCFCAGGALEKVSPETVTDCFNLFRRTHGKGITTVNDNEGHEAVLAAMDEIIENLKKSQSKL